MLVNTNNIKILTLNPKTIAEILNAFRVAFIYLLYSFNQAHSKEANNQKQTEPNKTTLDKY